MTAKDTAPAAPAWAIPPDRAAAVCEAFIRDTLAAAGRERLVLGLSGGIDSAVAAALAARAVGPGAVTGLIMPYATSTASSRRDAEEVAGRLGIAAEVVPITPLADPFLTRIEAAERVRRGNVMARCRMILLFDRSARDRALVLGTGNRTESLLGYTTLHGDDACGLNPLARLYKTEVRLLARLLDLPPAVLAKPPSADLWEGQADEDELGMSYAEVDALLHAMVDRSCDEAALRAEGFAPELIARVRARMAATAFKRRLPPAAEFGERPAGTAPQRPDASAPAAGPASGSRR